MAGAGVVAGVVGGFVLAQLAGAFVTGIMQMPGALPLAGARRSCWSAAAIVASLLPAARAARVDVMQALRSE